MLNREQVDKVKHWAYEIIKAIEREEKILIQKIKVNWLKLWDGNKIHFHATLRSKNKKIDIYKLEDPNGQLIIGDKKIFFYSMVSL